MKRIVTILCLTFILIMSLALPAAASTPYQTYTYSINGTALYSPDAYTPERLVDAHYMGLTDEALLRRYHPDLEEAYQTGLNSGSMSEYQTMYTKYSQLSNPSDIEVDDENNVYIADVDNNRIVVLNRFYKVKYIIASFLNGQGIADSLALPQGVYITPDKIVAGERIAGKIYVCDTDNRRIVTFTHDGEFLKVIPKPESQLFSDTGDYHPVALAVDNYDRLYVVSDRTTEGIIVMTEEGLFTGFIGAQKVSSSAWAKLWKKFQSDEQEAMSEDTNSVSFNNITLTGDFIYITTDKIEESQVLSSLETTEGTYAPVKMLNAAGDEIMRRNGFFAPSGEIDQTKNIGPMRGGITGASIIVDVAVGPEKTWSIIDQKRSKVFTYDFDGNLLFAFGDHSSEVGSSQLGTFKQGGLSGITYQGDAMLMLDKMAGTFTVFNRTDYGDVLIQALHHQNLRQNDKAIQDWTEILKRNSNFDAAYVGIGNALFRSGQYEESLGYFESAYDTVNYSNSYKEIRKEWMSKYILLIPVIIVLICIGWAKLMGHAKKVNKRVGVTKGKKTYGQELIYVFHVIFHPFDGFWDLKREKRGSVRAGTTILAAVILTFYYQAIGQGYIANPTGETSSFFGVVLSVLVPLFLWVVGNWCLTTLFDGEGSFRDIYIATTYALAPMVIFLIPTTIASHFMLADELNLLTLLNALAFIWVGMLIFFGMMVTHDYSMGKNVLTTLGTIVAMVCIMFIAILFSTLLTKLVGFVTNIVTEVQYRL